jgi:hypothetical protein
MLVVQMVHTLCRTKHYSEIKVPWPIASHSPSSPCFTVCHLLPSTASYAYTFFLFSVESRDPPDFWHGNVFIFGSC